MVIAQPHEVWHAIQPVDMRLGIDGLSRLVQDALNKAPCDGSAYGYCHLHGDDVEPARFFVHRHLWSV